MSTEAHTIPDDIRKAAYDCARGIYLNVDDSGTPYMTDDDILEVAKAINDAVIAERKNKAQTTRKKIIDALVDFPHSIDDSKVEIRFDPRRPGHNALNQFLTALEEQFSTAPKAEEPCQ